MYVFLSIKKLVLFKNVFFDKCIVSYKREFLFQRKKVSKTQKTKQKNKCLR